MKDRRLPMTNLVTKMLVLTLALNLVTISFVQTAEAGAIGTGDYISYQQREQRIDRVQAFLAEQSVQAQLISLGVDPAAAADRVASMTATELAALDPQIADLPAGGNALAVVGVVFVVLIILELVGVTNIFTNI